MALELFSKKGGRYNEPRISINTTGQIGLNSSCLERYIKSKKYILLYFDKDKNIIGVKAVDKNEDNAFKISYSVKKTSGSISGHSFMKYLKNLGVNLPQNRRFTPEWNEKDNMLIIKL